MDFQTTRYHHGPLVNEDSVLFRLWAPKLERVNLKVALDGKPHSVPMIKHDDYFCAKVDVFPASHSNTIDYLFELPDSRSLPDPASRWQPHGVHQASRVVLEKHSWRDASFEPPHLCDLVLYETHIGTFSNEGDFDAATLKLDSLKQLGINAIEVMPIAQFPGARNWGYDGVYPFAAHASYGGPAGFKRFVDACHELGMAVILDVVYNHIGPEGNYFDNFGHYFTERYRTPWGKAINFDGPYSDEVRRYFIENALYWISECHVDGLRLDAVHAIVDESASHFLQKLSSELKGSHFKGGDPLLIAESDANTPRTLQPVLKNGFGMDAQWCDDFHHALHTVLTKEDVGYYQDYGRVAHLAKSFQRGFVYTGEYSKFRKRCHGACEDGIAPERFVVFSQNHDQVGNRMLGERLSALLPFDKLKTAAAATLLSPFTPLIFMGEEYGEKQPFLYFTSHSDPDLIAAVRKGRREEFADFKWHGHPPDPQLESTFLASKLSSAQGGDPQQKKLHELYRRLISLRRELVQQGFFLNCRRTASEVQPGVLKVAYASERGRTASLFLAFDFQGHIQDELFKLGQPLFRTNDERWHCDTLKFESTFATLFVAESSK